MQHRPSIPVGVFMTLFTFHLSVFIYRNQRSKASGNDGSLVLPTKAVTHMHFVCPYLNRAREEKRALQGQSAQPHTYGRIQPTVSYIFENSNQEIEEERPNSYFAQ